MKRLLFLLLLATGLLGAAEERPWIERPLQLFTGVKAAGEWFDHLDRDGKELSYHGRNLLIDANMRLATSSNLEFELELCTSRTHHHTYSIDACKQSVRYLLLEDALGDPFALSIGLTLTEAWNRAVFDPALLYRGNFAVELHTAQGVEREWTECTNYRLYAVEAIGFSSGSPWVRGVAGVELFTETGHLLGSKMEGICGFGNRALCPSRFDGYGSIAYRIVDFSLYYTFRTDSWQYYTLEGLYRVYARNAPSRLFHLEVSIIF